MSTPIVPARPSRSTAASGTTSDLTPSVPPRPIRKLDPSPNRAALSPFNELPPGGSYAPATPSKLSVEDTPARPPSVTLPSIGQEGSEYAYGLLPPEVPGITNPASAELGTPEQTRNVSRDTPLHAPTASLPQSTAKSRIETVTQTNSTQAAAAGIGKAKPADDVHNTPADSDGDAGQVESGGDALRRAVTVDSSALRPKSSFSRPASSGQHHSRPASTMEDPYEQGIPHHGLYAPLNPNAGDVQAPSPGPTQSQLPSGIGFFNDGSARAHSRRKSANFAPPGSYGLHSHFSDHQDRFERDWYAKNRERAAIEEQNQFGRPQPSNALSSAELNRIVTRDDAGSGGVGTPAEEVAFATSEAYVVRNSPRSSPQNTQTRRKRLSSGSQPAVESPLRRASYFPRTSEAVDDDDDVDPMQIDTSNEDRGPGTPALASDEVLKRGESYALQAAVTPDQQYDSYDEYAQQDNSRRNSMRVPSRPSSRPGSVHMEYHGGPLHRFTSHDDHHGTGTHTPLEEIEEYEPLIPEGEEDTPRARVKAKDLKRRPGLEHHHFPSRDVWEDTPSSMYYSTTVEVPDDTTNESTTVTVPAIVKTTEDVKEPATADSDREVTAEVVAVKPHYASRAIDRPGVQRFPSKDIWEDTPSSMQYSTTVGGPQMDESKDMPDDRPTTPAMVSSQDDDTARATTGLNQNLRPSVPARPQRKSKLAEELKPEDLAAQQESSRNISEDAPSSPEKSKAPPIPDRPKPTIPVRPARSARGEQANGAGSELIKTTSKEDEAPSETVKSAPAPKGKPAIPARPTGEKISALKTGFMSALNDRLKLGPQAPPTKSRELEPEAEDAAPKAPLEDARKGRAKGPARRKPAASPSAVVEEKASALSFSTPLTIWSIDEDAKLQVPSSAGAATSASPTLEKVLTINAKDNVKEAAPTADADTAEKEISQEAVEAKLEEIKSPEKAVTSPLGIEEASQASPVEQKEIIASLQASLASVGAGPAPETSSEDAKESPPDDTVEDQAALKKSDGPAPKSPVKDEHEALASEFIVQDETPVEEGIQGVAAS